ncbi:thermostable beta-glucosidase B [Xylariales sp. PMI_506]|nr:thermostable beta-glucosidase B [Xylariales sp. PMI_506]
MTTACFPSTTCLASTWDAELLNQMGQHVADQALIKSAQVVLGPTINIHRDPRAGRNFECLSEDPLLSGQLAAAMVNGIQSRGVAACPKHIVCNDSEYLRHFYDVRESLDGRTLREIYLGAWQHLLRASDPWALMTAYNQVDGTFCSEHTDLIDLVRSQWGYKGIFMSDWFGVHSTVGPIKAGLDLEMPLPVFRSGRLIKAVKTGAVTEEEIDARVLKMLQLRDLAKESLKDEPERSEINEETNKLAREVARAGIVLLKNENGSLPLNVTAESKIAVIGEFANRAVATGGGSASCNPQYEVTPVDALKETLAGVGKVEFAGGVRTRRIIPVASPSLLARGDGQHGADVKYFNDDLTEPVFTESLEKAEVWMLGHFKPGLNCPGSRLELTTQLKSPSKGVHTLAVRCTGSFSLLVDGKEVLAGEQREVTTEQFIFNHILLESRVEVPMEADQTYDIRLVMRSRDKLTVNEPTPYAASFCFEESYCEEAAINAAVELAKASDTSIIFAGRDGQYESEGYDLESITMPPNQTALIKAVAAASRRTILVLHCGNPIDVSDFVDDVDAVINAHFPGQEGSAAIAEILAGKVSPSGRLATTWFKTLEDSPSYGNFPSKKLEDGTVQIKYAEGLQIGYRHPEQTRVRWPFGFGLSYADFSYGDLDVKVAEAQSENPKLSCSIKITNTGSVAGHEVVQLYVTPSQTTSAWRPARELKAFTRIFLQPGESKIVDLTSDLRVSCSYWDEEVKQWRLDQGRYGVEVRKLTAEFEVDRAETWNHL